MNTDTEEMTAIMTASSLFPIAIRETPKLKSVPC